MWKSKQENLELAPVASTKKQIMENSPFIILVVEQTRVVPIAHVLEQTIIWGSFTTLTLEQKVGQ